MLRMLMMTPPPPRPHTHFAHTIITKSEETSVFACRLSAWASNPGKCGLLLLWGANMWSGISSLHTWDDCMGKTRRQSWARHGYMFKPPESITSEQSLYLQFLFHVWHQPLATAPSSDHTFVHVKNRLSCLRLVHTFPCLLKSWRLQFPSI